MRRRLVLIPQRSFCAIVGGKFQLHIGELGLIQNIQQPEARIAFIDAHESVGAAVDFSQLAQNHTALLLLCDGKSQDSLRCAVDGTGLIFVFKLCVDSTLKIDVEDWH